MLNFSFLAELLIPITSSIKNTQLEWIFKNKTQSLLFQHLTNPCKGYRGVISNLLAHSGAFTPPSEWFLLFLINRIKSVLFFNFSISPSLKVTWKTDIVSQFKEAV